MRVALAAGTRLGTHEITGLLGVGGMGEVYRARDTRLNRDVALKILPDTFAADPDRLARFTREAQTLAVLNDLHIAHIYGLEEQEGRNGQDSIRALAMEYVDGEDLAERLKRGPIPADEALAIARQIIDGMEAAHDQGIVHRDLKPANIKVTAEGVVKILDFGLAKAIDATSASPTAAALSYSPTITSPLAMTAAGMILGTAAYMSPEQARGKAVDRRTDIWAFGCILFEMLTGRTPFPGEDVIEVIGALVHKEPEWTTLPAATGPLVRVALQRCLEKNPKKRIRDVADVRLLLDGAFDSPRSETGNVATAPAAAHGTWSVAGIAAAAALLVGAIAGAATWASTRPKPARAQTARFAITLPAAQTIRVSNADRNLAVSPDGTHLVYVTAGGNGGQLIVRAIDRLDAEPLRGIDNARAPFWSPDSKWIGYFNNQNEIRKVSVSGGPPISVCQTSGAPRGASWGSVDTIIFATNDTSTGLMSVRAGGGQPQVL